MTDLQKKLREIIEYDENHMYSTASKRYGAGPLNRAFKAGVEYRNERLSPILAALEGCVEALESICGNRCAIGLNPCEARDALETLRKILEEK